MGMTKSTPNNPPASASRKMRVYSSGKPRKISAGNVKTTPAAMDSPAEPVVCTMLFSRMVDLPSHLKMLIESTAMGMEALTVNPARSARYTETAPKTTPSSAPTTTARSVNSGTLASVGT